MNNSDAEEKPKAKLNWLSYSSGIVIVIAMGLGLMANIIGENIYYKLGSILSFVALCLALSAPFLAILSEIQISTGKSQNKNSFLPTVILGLFIATSFMISTAAVPGLLSRDYMHKMICRSNMGKIRVGIESYAKAHDGYLPSGNWCDELILEYNVAPEDFVCRGADMCLGESSYILNKNFAGKKLSEIPDDAVLVFETDAENMDTKRDFDIKNRAFAAKKLKQHWGHQVYKDKWNQVAGPELLTIQNHRHAGYNILFAGKNIYSKWDDKLEDLNWGLTDTEVFPIEVLNAKVQGNVINKVIISLFGIALFIFILKMAFVFNVKKNLSSCIKFALIAGVGGLIMGYFSGMLHSVHYAHYLPLGFIIVSIFGFLVGGCFFAFLLEKANKTYLIENINSFAVQSGMLVGLICSMLVHLSMTVIYEDSNYISIIAGMPYGIIAGAALGKIAGIMVKKNKTLAGDCNEM